MAAISKSVYVSDYSNWGNITNSLFASDNQVLMKVLLTKLCNPQYFVEGDENVLNNLNITRENCLELAGGIPFFEDSPLECRIEIKSPLHIYVKVESSQHRASRALFFGQQVIQNDSLRIFETQRGTGRILLLQQLDAARKFGFKRIFLRATGGSETFGGDWMGHYVWGRLGFSMKEEYISDFRKWQSTFSCEGDTIFEMLKVKEYQDKWKDNGFTWNGCFITDPRSINSKNFIEYCNEKLEPRRSRS